MESSYQSEVAQLMARIRQLEGRECPNCKKRIQMDAKFCAYCGAKQT